MSSYDEEDCYICSDEPFPDDGLKVNRNEPLRAKMPDLYILK